MKSKMMLKMVLLLICVLMIGGCNKISETKGKSFELQEYPAFYFMGVFIYINNSGNVYTWGYDRYNNNMNKYGYGSDASLGQGTEVLYNNLPTLIYKNITYIHYGRITTSDGQMAECGCLLEDKVCIPQVVREDQKDIYMAFTNIYLTKNGDLYAIYNKEKVDLPVPYGTEDTLVLKNVTQYEGGYALKSDGTVWAFHKDSNTKLICDPYKIMDGVMEIIGSFNDASLFLKTDKTLWALGNNEYGMIGNGEYGDWDDSTRDYVNEPYLVMENVVKAWVGEERRFYALDTEGNLFGWGLNTYNVLLEKSFTQTSIGESGWTGRQIISKPQFMMSEVYEVYDYGNCAFAVKNDGSLWSWGAADRGELGNGQYAKGVSLNMMDMAMRMAGESAIICEPKKIMDGIERMLGSTAGLKFALKDDGTILYWGYDTICVGADEDWDTDMSQAYKTDAYFKHVIIPTPQIFDLETFHSEYQ